MNFRKSVLSLFILSIPTISHAELSISNSYEGTSNNGVVLFDKSSNQTTSGNDNSVSSAATGSSDSDGDGDSSDNNYSSDGDSDSGDLSPSEVQEIESSGGTVENVGVPKNKTIKKGYGNKVTSGIPDYYSYNSIDEAFADAINISKNTPSKISGNDYPILKKGSQGTQVAILSLALVKKGFLDLAGQPTPTVYDDDIVAAVKLAQKSLGITVDGIAGPQLFMALGISVNKNSNAVQGLTQWKNKIDSLIAQAKADGRNKIIIVNIPSFTLKAIDVNTGKVVIESKVVVGRPIHQTPMKTIDVIGIKYNPNWTPPMSVIKRDVLNNLSSSNAYIRSHNLKAVDSAGNTYNIDTLSREDILSERYRIQQAPGTSNSLGVLKFETNSPDNIYLHDTNERFLFSNINRANSLGCIRVQQWYPLSQFVSNQSGDTIKNDLDKGKTYIQRVDKVPVYIMYSLYDVVKGKPGKYRDIYNEGGSLLQ